MNTGTSFIAVCVALFTASMLSGCGEEPTPPDVPSPPAPPHVGPRSTPVAVPDSETVHLPIGSGRPQPLRLEAGQTALGTLVAPWAGKLVAFEVKLGNYFNSSTGLLKLDLCKGEGQGQQCADGRGDLLTSLDNQMFTIVLDQPLEVATAQSLSFRLRKEGGDKEVVVWTYPSTSGDAQTISRKDGKAAEGRTAQLALRYAR